MAMTGSLQNNLAATGFNAATQSIGVNIISGAIADSGKTLGQAVVLDAGCGGGHYSKALIGRVGQIDAVDISNAQLAIAHRRLADEALDGRIRFHHCDIQALPFPDNHFDGVMANQVLSHLETDDNEKYALHSRVLGEFFRVLRRDGACVLNCTTQTQLREGFWHYNLIPDALEAYLPRTVPSARLVELLHAAGFVFEGRTVPLDALLIGNRHFEPTGPLDPSWRRVDPVWTTATMHQIGNAEERLRAMQREEELDHYLAKLDDQRPRVGQCTFFVARRP